jgi:hypothetical protein
MSEIWALFFQCSHTYDESQASYNNGDATSESLEYVIFEVSHDLLIHIISRMTSEENFRLEMAYETMQQIFGYCQEHFSKNALIMKSKARCKAVLPKDNFLQESQQEDENDEDPPSEINEGEKSMRVIAAPLPNGLFSIEDGCLHYNAQVEASLPQQQNEPEGEEEVEQEHAGPEREQQPLHDFTTYQDMYALEGSIENLSNLAINLQDTTNDLTSQFTHWSGQWNFGNYPPPPQ